jgi:tyrosine-protein kinase Etk/Wzc
MKNAAQSKNVSNPFENVSSKNVLNVIAFRYLPFWPIFVLTIFFSLLISYIYIHYQTPIYEANSTILLKDQKSGQMDGSVLEALGVSSSAKTVENELEILKSRTLMQQVVKNMGLYTQVYSKGALRDILIYPNPVTFVAINPDLIKDSPNLLISFDEISKGKITIDGKQYLLGSTISTPYGAFVVSSPKNSIWGKGPVKGEYYLQIRSVKSAARGLSGALAVAPVGRQSSLIGLKFADQVPMRAEEILNALVDAYNKAGIDDKRTSTGNTLDFINERLILVTRELSNVEGEMQSYRTKEGFLDISEEGQAFLENVKANDQKYAGIQIQLDVLSQIEKYLVKKGAKAGTVPSTLGITDPIFSQLLQNLYAAETELSTMRQTAGENSPAVISVQERINQIKISLLENLQTLRQNLNAQRKGLQNEINRNTGLLKTVPKKERAFIEISRQQAIKNNIYTLLLTKREEVALSRASAVPDSRIVNSAEAKGAPIKPLVFNIYLIGLTIGIVAGVGFVLITEQYNQEVLFRAEIERVTSVPVIAEILHDNSGKTLVIKDGSRTVIAEQFRALRTSLSFIGIHGDKKVVLVTSSISGEGKSFTALNLAVSLALTGKKVAMLEFDLRKPKISKMLGIKLEPGISNYMAGIASYDDILRTMPDNSVQGLYILSAGAIPPNPTELMLNGKLDELMTKLRQDFDYILIDSPPIGLVTDAKILNRYVDASLYMVRHKYTPKRYLNLVENIHANNELNNINIIFNGLKTRGVFGGSGYGAAYGYGSGYGYGTGYSYGYTNEDKKTIASGIKSIFRKRNKNN